jgi:thiamine-phosphate diphosphorylase
VTISAERSPLPRLHVVTDDRVLAEDGLPRRAAAVLEAGGSRLALHVRGPATSGRALFDIAGALVREARGTDSLLLVNDRIDVALAVGANGAQLGSRGIGTAAGRRLLPGRWLGASVHEREEGLAAVRDGADFLVVGTLFATTSHPGRAPEGKEVLRTLAKAGAPLVGIGGVTPGRVKEVLRAGGWGVAVIRGVWKAPDPAAAVQEYLDHLEKSGGT